MNDTKRCPACNQQVPALAVRCKFCGIRLDVAVSGIPMTPPTEPPGDEDDDLDLGSDDDLSSAAIPIAALSARLSAPPPARASISTAPPARGPISSAPPLHAAKVSAPPPAPMPPSIAAPPAPVAAPRVSAPPIVAPRVSGGPPPVAPPSIAPAAPVPPMVKPAGVSSVPPPARVASPVASAAPPAVTTEAHAAPPPSAHRTMLGMAPVTVPGAGSSLPRPSTSTAPAASGGMDLDDFEPTPMPGALPASAAGSSVTGPAMGDVQPALGGMPPAFGGDIFSSSNLDSLDLDGDIIDDDVDEISKFTEQTAVTDVSTLALGISPGRPEEPVDVPMDILDEIMEPTPATAMPLPSAPPKPQLPVPHSSVPPIASSRPPVASSYPPSSSAHAAIPPMSKVPAPFSPSASTATQPVLSAPISRHLAGGVPGLRPLGPMLESDTGIHDVSAARGGSMKMVYIFVGLIVLVVGGLIAYQFLGGEETQVASSDGAQPTGSKTEASAPDNAKGETKDGQTGDAATKDSKPKEHKCKSLSSYPSFAWRDKLDTLAEATNKSAICGLFGVSKEDIVTAMRGVPNFGPTGYDLLPRSTVFEIFPLGKAERRAPSIELVFIEDALFEIRMNYATAESASLDPEMFKSALGAPKVVADDPLSREIKIYTDEDMMIFWYKKTDPYKRVFNEVVFSSRLVRGTMEKELKNRSDAQIAFEQGMVLFNQKQPMRAVAKFRDARKIIPKMGSAYIFEGLALLQNEQFDKVETVAEQGFENSTDDRARGGAKGLQAVVALYRGDKEGALTLFNNAAGLDPADPEFSTAVTELKSGEYDPSRVAKTAARMDCRKDHAEWTAKGLLARGNFPDDEVFEKAEKSARKKPGYKAAFDMWNAWECK